MNKRYYGRKTIIGGSSEKREAFIDIQESLRSAQQYGKGPYYELTFTEAEEFMPGNYWGWKDFKEGYIFIHPSKLGIEICFPHGTKLEEENKRGKLVELVLKSEVKIG